MSRRPQPRVGDNGDDGGDDGDDDGDGRIFPEHPSPILHAPREICETVKFVILGNMIN